ncbi:hypothetical protein ARMGADRAFT_324591 [Armillaria gallica]|uniref:Uncharacterized protein n=1 Tax=Armillaria gallica TaxID=47427 RepID=A0A2H3DDM2_ARMGA|nr:hypothetical protein ARMGADRAFT_324591 [Armillaria gallica]
MTEVDKVVEVLDVVGVVKGVVDVDVEVEVGVVEVDVLVVVLSEVVEVEVEVGEVVVSAAAEVAAIQQMIPCYNYMKNEHTSRSRRRRR